MGARRAVDGGAEDGGVAGSGGAGSGWAGTAGEAGGGAVAAEGAGVSSGGTGAGGVARRTSSGASTVSGRRAQAFLFKANHLVDLGSPVVGQVLARGATPGDVLCVFDPANNRQGCRTLGNDRDRKSTLLNSSHRT